MPFGYCALRELNAQAAFDKAGEKCPGGYNIIGTPATNQANNYTITVECK